MILVRRVGTVGPCHKRAPVASWAMTHRFTITGLEPGSRTVEKRGSQAGAGTRGGGPRPRGRSPLGARGGGPRARPARVVAHAGRAAAPRGPRCPRGEGPGRRASRGARHPARRGGRAVVVGPPGGDARRLPRGPGGRRRGCARRHRARRASPRGPRRPAGRRTRRRISSPSGSCTGISWRPTSCGTAPRRRSSTGSSAAWAIRPRTSRTSSRPTRSPRPPPRSSCWDTASRRWSCAWTRGARWWPPTRGPGTWRRRWQAEAAPLLARAAELAGPA